MVGEADAGPVERDARSTDGAAVAADASGSDAAIPDANAPAPDRTPDDTGITADAGADRSPQGGAWIWQSGAASTASSLNAVWAPARDDAFVVGDSGAMLHWNGTSWSAMASGTKVHLSGIWGSSATDAWAVGGGVTGAGDYSSLVHWDGVSWKAIASATSVNLKSVWGAGAQEVWAVGGSGVAGVILHFDGRQWTQSMGSQTNVYNGVWGAGARDLWVLGGVLTTGSNQQLLHYTGQWSTFMPPGQPQLLGVWQSRSGRVWAVGRSMLLWDGTSWTAAADARLVNLAAVWGTADDDVWTASADRAFHYDGTSWTSYDTGGTRINGIGGANRDHVWAVADHGTVLAFDPGASGPITCQQVGGRCGAASACAPGQGHLTDYSCAGGSVCCVSATACGGATEPSCCTPGGQPADRARCRSGHLECVGASFCPVHP
jgi:hypothetical protein